MLGPLEAWIAVPVMAFLFEENKVVSSYFHLHTISQIQ